jgi:hypothetical protein
MIAMTMVLSAAVTFLPAEEGGRANAPASGYRAPVWFGQVDDSGEPVLWDFEFAFPERGVGIPVRFGEEMRAESRKSGREMSKDRGRLTAQELIAQLESDPKWVADRKRRDIDHREAAAGDVEAARPVVDELRAAGFAIEAIADLYHRPQDYSRRRSDPVGLAAAGREPGGQGGCRPSAERGVGEAAGRGAAGAGVPGCVGRRR